MTPNQQAFCGMFRPQLSTVMNMVVGQSPGRAPKCREFAKQVLTAHELFDRAVIAFDELDDTYSVREANLTLMAQHVPYDMRLRLIAFVPKAIAIPDGPVTTLVKGLKLVRVTETGFSLLTPSEIVSQEEWQARTRRRALQQHAAVLVDDTMQRERLVLGALCKSLLGEPWETDLPQPVTVRFMVEVASDCFELGVEELRSRYPDLADYTAVQFYMHGLTLLHTATTVLGILPVALGKMRTRAASTVGNPLH